MINLSYIVVRYRKNDRTLTQLVLEYKDNRENNGLRLDTCPYLYIVLKTINI